MPNIDELWNKYKTYYPRDSIHQEMTKENFTKAIAEIIAFGVEPPVMPIAQPKAGAVVITDIKLKKDSQ